MCSNFKVALCTLMLISGIMGFGGIGYACAVDNRPNDGISIVKRVLTHEEAHNLLDENGHVTIPNDITSIGNNAFKRVMELTSITIPNSVTSIGNNAFERARRLASVTIPNGVTLINDSAFLGCSGLTEIIIPSSVTSIGHEAFFGCVRLKEITIPRSVTSIGCMAFYGCTSLKRVNIFSEEVKELVLSTSPWLYPDMVHVFADETDMLEYDLSLEQAKFDAYVQQARDEKKEYRDHNPEFVDLRDVKTDLHDKDDRKLNLQLDIENLRKINKGIFSWKSKK